MEGSDSILAMEQAKSQGSNVSDSFPLATVKKCAKTANLDFDILSTCFNGPESKTLEQQYFDMTPADHTYVPWVVINGKLMDDSDVFLDAVCKAYTGDKPAGCTSSKPIRCYA